MISGTLIFAVNQSSQAQILGHLACCDKQFIPSLSSRTNLGEYAAKIRSRAQTFEAWNEGCLVGLVAAYFNDCDKICFITSVSVLPEQSGKGVAARLLAACMEAAREKGLTIFSLEVSSESPAAVQLYNRFGFQVIGFRGEIMTMECRDGRDAELA
jgi:ribosomal protein S18 acetylase RimI-like enzyme